MKTSIAWFAENHVAANLLMFFLIVAGVFTLSSIKLEIFPETTLDQINITTIYSGASPSEVEEAVVRRIEEKIAGLSGIKRIDSKCREGTASIKVEVMKDWDANQLLDDIKSEVDRITTLPDEAEKPVVSQAVRRSQVINVAVYGNVHEAAIKYWTEQLRDELTNLPGISQADISAVRESEIHIEISEATLRRYNLTLATISGIVAQHSLDLPAGSIDTSGGEVLVRTKGRRYQADNYRDIPIITRTDGSQVTLGQLAVIRDHFEDVDLFARFEGQPAGVISVYRVADQSALAVADTVKKFITAKTGTLPEGVQTALFADRSKILRSRMELLYKNMFYGLCLVALMLGIFLNLRLAFWVTLGIPISFAASLIFLPYYDVSINMISLFAFIMVLGVVVDDAIIVGENIFRHGEKGSPPLKAAVQGALEVGRPVIFSVLTTMVAFWPLLQAGGTMGKLMRNIPIVVILVLAGSLVESLYILPAHLVRSRTMKSSHTTKPNVAAYALRRFINGPYKRLLSTALNWRYITLSLGLFTLIITMGVWKGGRIKFVFFPKVESDTMQALLTMPAGTPVKRTQHVVNRLENSARKAINDKQQALPKKSPALLQYISTTMGAHYGRGVSGNSGNNLAMVQVQLIEGEDRSVSTLELTRSWRKAMGQVPDAESLSFKSSLHSFGNAIEVDLSHDNNEMLLLAVQDLKDKLRGYTGVSDIEDNFLPGKVEMQLKLKPGANNLGITLEDLARQVRHALYGAEALRFQRDQDEVKVMVRFPESERQSLVNVEQMRIRTPEGKQIPFTAIAEVDMQRGYALIERTQRRRVITVSADVDENKANADEIRQELEAKFLPGLKNKYPNLRHTTEGEGRNRKESLSDVFRSFIIALFGIYALLAIPFRSFSQPFVVMGAIPFGIVGAVWGHLIMGFNLSIISLFGIVGLTGVVVNDSLVLVHRTNALRREGLTPLKAVQKASAARFRAIALTSLTTFAGLTPMLLERSIQARFLIPMAVSLGFGVLFGTVITLILIPCGYLVLNDIHSIGDKFLRFAGIRKPEKLPDTISQE
ncbi:MAG: efflux RND transporter permease subunit [Desulfobacteraceae bacterium]|nr:efflux RND transporter permease subunit [Desulfobacteraceae bacterium]